LNSGLNRKKNIFEAVIVKTKSSPKLEEKHFCFRTQKILTVQLYLEIELWD